MTAFPFSCRARVLLMFLLVAPAILPAADNELSNDFYDRVKQACIEVLVDDHLNGSGWIAESSGVVVTAAHVIGTPAGKRIEVLLNGGGRVDASVIAMDRANDIALLRIPERDGGHPVLSFAKKPAAAGLNIYLFGAPIQRHGVLLKGLVARNDTTFEFYAWMNDYVEILHATGVGPPGTSGGPWMNSRGEVVGLNSGMMRDNGAPAGVGFLIPAAPIGNLLKSKRTVQTATLRTALEETWQQPRDFLKRFAPRTEGLVVLKPRADGPLVRAGVKDGDVIVAADDVVVRTPDPFLKMIRGKKPGDEVKLKILSGSNANVREVTVRLDDLEAQ